MADIAIKIEKLSKQYHIGKKQERYYTLRDTLSDTFLGPFRRTARLLRGHSTGASDLNEIIWALKDISFEVERGEVVGIIGRNGAGKSTLLKILSRITEPTEGYARIRGRISSLLEVGTGFHPELTGRENVFLNGAILGMGRNEIDQKFDEIVAFSEVEKFIDTPVKHYSSGMSLRLAFAVAAHLEPEILIVDEVLAVGDARFQRKCINKMQDVGKHGRTVLFVSHNMPSITRLCQRAILLNGGQVVQDGPVDKIVSSYLSSELSTMAVREWPTERAPGDDVVRLRSVRVRDEAGEVAEAADIRRSIGLEMEYDVLKPGYKLMPYYNVFNEDGVKLFTAIDQDPAWQGQPRPAGRYVSIAWIPGNLLAEGTVIVSPAMRTLEPMIRHFLEPDAVAFHIIDTLDGDSVRGGYAGNLGGVIRPTLKWNTQYQAANGVGVHDEKETIEDLRKAYHGSV